MKILNIPITKNEKYFGVIMYIFGLVHVIGTASVLLYFLAKTIKNCVRIGKQNKRNVNIK